ncbi:MAG: hypothetical protein P0Y53_02835 [Candidatus Pseudobacter hemicellulosilyticus]|uniref:Uncharacterized protein n=1 Tax=Candidatus Pseudobacter hemicellulosilyticus TaxID=3121375 RepID=A0AAJ6BI16_9BACT|nr:MAG: hypothetical protein P0Y53_02835 [Pseudobacter sp.]
MKKTLLAKSDEDLKKKEIPKLKQGNNLSIESARAYSKQLIRTWANNH